MANLKERELKGEVSPFGEIEVTVTGIRSNGTRISEGMIMLSEETAALHYLEGYTSIDCQLIDVERNGHIPVKISDKKIAIDLIKMKNFSRLMVFPRLNFSR